MATWIAAIHRYVSFSSLIPFLHLTLLVNTLPSAHGFHRIFLQGSAAQGWENKPNQVPPFLALHDWIRMCDAEVQGVERTDGVCSCLTLTATGVDTFHLKDFFFFYFIKEECWRHDMSSVNCRGLNEASIWRVWCWRGGHMTACRLTVRSSTHLKLWHKGQVWKSVSETLMFFLFCISSLCVHLTN